MRSFKKRITTILLDRPLLTALMVFSSLPIGYVILTYLSHRISFSDKVQVWMFLMTAELYIYIEYKIADSLGKIMIEGIYRSYRRKYFARIIKNRQLRAVRRYCKKLELARERRRRKIRIRRFWTNMIEFSRKVPSGASIVIYGECGLRKVETDNQQ